MRVTHVVRGDEWLASLPVHVQLFGMCGFALPYYAHTATVMKLDGGSKRKLSKRHDPEADVRYLREEGYPVQAVMEYVMTLANSNYEEWRAANPQAAFTEFPFRLSKMGISGALFDINKLRDVSKNIISGMTAGDVYKSVTAWAEEFKPDFGTIIGRDPEYALAVFGIGRGGEKPRKDIAAWKEVPEYISYFYDEYYQVSEPFPDTVDIETRQQVLRQYAAHIDLDGDNTQWFESIKVLAAELGFTADNKAYKADPNAYKGKVGDYTMILRVAVCGRQNAPDLFSVMRLLGKQRTAERLIRAAE
jgi:glutamyl-tRNA synthetase